MQNHLERLRRAAVRRVEIRAAGTDALRLVDGAADEFPGVELDDFAGRWLVQTRSEHFPEWLRGLAPVSLYWKQLGRNEAPQWISGEILTKPFVVTEQGMQFWIDFNVGYSQGFFIDQRDNRRRVRERFKDCDVLNCFAYTCAFGVAASAGGARTTNIDLSMRYLEWGRRNYVLNNVPVNEHEFLRGDVFAWLKRFDKRRRRFDVIILDPPTFSRGEKGRVFTIEKGFPELVQLATRLLRSRGAVLCTTNQRGLNSGKFRKILGQELTGQWHFASASMPADFRNEQYLKTFWMETHSSGS